MAAMNCLRYASSMTQQIDCHFPEVYKSLDLPHRYKILYGGRAAARSWTIARKLLLRGAEKPLRILCTRELQKSIKQSVHRLLSDQINMLGLDTFYRVEQQGIFGRNGTEFMFLGVKHNTEEVKSTEGIDICWIEEGHSLSEASFDIIDPTIRKAGSEIWISFNTRFKHDHVYHTFVLNDPPPGSLVIKSSYRDNPYFPDVLQQQMDTMKSRDYENYLHIWEGELKQLAEGAIFGKQITEVKRENRLCSIPVLKNAQVFTYADLGKRDETAFWFVQYIGKEARFIDYLQGRLEDIPYYVEQIKSFGYNYGTHYMPHDADHDRLGMTKNIREQFEEAGIRPVEIVPVTRNKQNAIEAARREFSRCYFHCGDDERGKRVAVGWDALCNYRYKFSDDDNVFSKSPHHDWASNGADAFMQFAQAEEIEETNDFFRPLNVSVGGIV